MSFLEGQESRFESLIEVATYGGQREHSLLFEVALHLSSGEITGISAFVEIKCLGRGDVVA